MGMLEDLQDLKSYPLTRTRPVFASEEDYAKAMIQAARKECHFKRLPKGSEESESLEVKASQMRRWIMEREGVLLADLYAELELTEWSFRDRRRKLREMGNGMLFYETTNPHRLFSSKLAYEAWRRK